MVIESISNIINESIVSEIIIVDDNSDVNKYNLLKTLLFSLNSPKIKLYRNEENKGAFLNKLECIKKSSNEWNILFDSDNVLTVEYVNSIPKNLDEKTFYLPSYAICNSEFLDYRQFSNTQIKKEQFKTLAILNDARVQCMLNTGNYLVSKNTYINALEKEKNQLNCFALDAFYQIFLCFKHIDAFCIFVTEGMSYYHRIHDKNTVDECNSFYAQNAINSQRFYEMTLKPLIKEI
jgi:glycosyltransferase involved in cell wall biosynthesis